MIKKPKGKSVRRLQRVVGQSWFFRLSSGRGGCRRMSFPLCLVKQAAKKSQSKESHRPPQRTRSPSAPSIACLRPRGKKNCLKERAKNR
ncbi:hypothetical protein [Pandoravirus japonicus]|uniref:Uncharacterized protein n=1 Tax=Pandoravirus japonicus TaxID=2823154 RepID=A0A811BPT5_9VIRU|nr:hypothetical protein [Pandoravirus japonicus]